MRVGSANELVLSLFIQTNFSYLHLLCVHFLFLSPQYLIDKNPIIFQLPLHERILME